LGLFFFFEEEEEEEEDGNSASLRISLSLSLFLFSFLCASHGDYARKQLSLLSHKQTSEERFEKKISNL